MKFSTFVFVNFVVSVVADIFLNDIANPPQPFPFKSKIIDSLVPYFKNKSIIVSGIYAGITICLTLVGVSLLSKSMFGFYVPNEIKELMLFCVLAFPIGFVVDIAIDKLKIFGKSLDPYYKVAGAGFWGSFAFITSIVTSYGIQKYLIPVL
tara:strand:- start:1202 stop:1654 length:453 start_codon:yes stop_codon:yes gene_type:complete